MRNIPAGINRRLSSISSDEKSFDREAPPYQKALDESGYNYRLKFDPPGPATGESENAKSSGLTPHLVRVFAPTSGRNS